MGKRKLYSSYDQRYDKAKFSRSNESVFRKKHTTILLATKIHKGSDLEVDSIDDY